MGVQLQGAGAAPAASLFPPSQQPPVSWRNPHGDEAGTAPGAGRRVGWGSEGTLPARCPCRPLSQSGCAHHAPPPPPRALQSSPDQGRQVTAPWGEGWSPTHSKHEALWGGPTEDSPGHAGSPSKEPFPHPGPAAARATLSEEVCLGFPSVAGGYGLRGSELTRAF